jgi:RimJ/RimL family protein N-acetyltransferase
VALAARYQTARLTLRPVVASDEAAVVAAIDDIAVSGWLAVVPHPYTVADFRYFLTEIAVPGEVFAIEDAMGFAGIMSIEDGVLGYWLAPRAQGLGYATEAGRCLVDAHFAASDASLISGYFEGNARSANVLRKLGFVETGRDMKHCRARGTDLPHVVVELTRAPSF